MILNSVLFLAATFFFTGSGEVRHFPQDEEALRNGAGRELFVVSRENGDPAHTLYLRNRKNGKVISILSFPRSIVVSWSPGGNKFFLSNKIGSNREECKAIEVGEDDSLSWIYLRPDPPRECESVDGTDHCFLSCTAWIGEGKLEGIFDYYGDQKAVRERIAFTLGSKVNVAP